MMCDKAGRMRPYAQELNARAERVMRVGVREGLVRDDDLALFTSVFTSILKGVLVATLDEGENENLAERRSARRSTFLPRRTAHEKIMPTTANPNAAQQDTTAAPEKKKSVRPYIILGIVFAVAGSIYAGFRVVTAGKESTDDAQVSTDMVPLSARVGGNVVTLPVTDNQVVKKGDLIAEIDPTDYQNRAKQAEAELAAAKAQADAADAQTKIVASSSKGGLTSARAALSGTAASASGADSQIAAAQAALERAQSDAAKADIDLKRAQQLRKDDAIPQAQVDTYSSTATSAHAAVAQAQAQLASARATQRRPRRRALQKHKVASSNRRRSKPSSKSHARTPRCPRARRQCASGAALANQQLAYTKIVAPFDGHISKLAVHLGQLVSPTQIITSVLPSTTYIVANFKETQVGKMRAGQAANISIDALPGRTLHAKVESISYGTGAQFSLLPPDNASGNFVKVVQRVPVKLTWVDPPSDVQLQAGLSVDVTVMTK